MGAQRQRLWPVVAAGAVLGLAFNVKLFEALLVAARAGRPDRAASRDGAPSPFGLRRRFVAVGLSWIAVASLTPLGHRPWPFGSTDGSIWSAVFDYNGVDRVSGAASAAALKLDPPGPLRFFTAGGHQYLWTVGTMLVAAVVLPLARARARGRRAARGRRRRRVLRRVAGDRHRAAEPHAAAGAALPRDGDAGDRRGRRHRRGGAARGAARSPRAAWWLALAAPPAGAVSVARVHHRSDAGLLPAGCRPRSSRG